MFDRIKRALLVFSAFLMIAILSSGAVMASDLTDDDDKRKKQRTADVIPGWVVVKFEDSYSVSASASKTGFQAVDRISERYAVQSVQKMFPQIDRLSANKAASLKGMDRLSQIYKMQISKDTDPFVVASALQALPEVEYAEPLFKERIAVHREYPSWMESLGGTLPMMATPNDAFFSNQSHLPHIMAPEAWDIIKGEQGDVVVAVLDGGTEWRHTDLQANIFINPNEIAGNGVDDDNNGFTDDVNGWDFNDEDGDPTGDLSFSPGNARHGTNTAGVVSAVTDNGTGVAGVSWNAKNFTCEYQLRS